MRYSQRLSCCGFSFFFFNEPSTTETYTLSLHDALPIFPRLPDDQALGLIRGEVQGATRFGSGGAEDRKSTRLNSSHTVISYAVFCLKKKRPARPLADRRRPRPLRSRAGRRAPTGHFALR